MMAKTSQLQGRIEKRKNAIQSVWRMLCIGVGRDILADGFGYHKEFPVKFNVFAKQQTPEKYIQKYLLSVFNYSQHF